MAICRQERLVKAWVKNGNLSLTDMYNKCCKEGWMDYLVETQESIREFIADKVRNGDCPCAKTLADIESDTRADLFKFDASCWGFGATPIYDKEELAEAMGY